MLYKTYNVLQRINSSSRRRGQKKKQTEKETVGKSVKGELM